MLERNRAEKAKWDAWRAANIVAVELVKDGNVAGYLAYHDTKEGRGAKTKIYNVNFKEHGYSLGNVMVIGPMGDEGWTQMGPQPEEQHNSEWDYLRYYRVPGYTSNRLTVMRDHCEANGLEWYGHYHELPQAKKKVREGPDLGLVDRVAWRAAGSPQGLTGGATLKKWWTTKGQAMLTRFLKLTGLKQPNFRGVSEKGFY
jgi:hypothetical protein